MLIKELRLCDFLVFPGEQVITLPTEGDTNPGGTFDRKFPRLVAGLKSQFAVSARLEKPLRQNPRPLRA